MISDRTRLDLGLNLPVKGSYTKTIISYLKSIQKSKNRQRRIFLDNYYRHRCLV
jgi:hypothetical protein